MNNYSKKSESPIYLKKWAELLNPFNWIKLKVSDADLPLVLQLQKQWADWFFLTYQHTIEAIENSTAKTMQPAKIESDLLTAPMQLLINPLDFWYEQLDKEPYKTLDPFAITRTFLEVQQFWLKNPQKTFSRWVRLNVALLELQLNLIQRSSGATVSDAVKAIEFDERFQDNLWTETLVFDALKQYYLLYTRWIADNIYEAPDIDEKTAKKAGFWAKQWINLIAPSNFFWTNPLAIRRYCESGGYSAYKGLQNFFEDMKYKTVRMVDNTAFEVGKNVGTTAGSVIYRNDLFELIQYHPQTETVREIPLLFIPPWINKFYILDLDKEKSIINYLLKQGYSVFMISWKNPTTEMRHIRMDDYLQKGVLQAVEVVQAVSQAPSVHAIGYCIGGIILTAAMAWLNLDKSKPCPISSWSLFTTLTDFSNPGEIDVFIDENTIAHIEEVMREKGYLDGHLMADAFRSLRTNSLLWFYFVHNYLYGEELAKFDILAWNMDSTRLPEAMHAFYLREFYLNNKLIEPNGLTLAGRSIDIRLIQQPLYDVSTEQDHIAPWRETFKKCAILKCPIRHTLATSGHILGVLSPPVNPPKRKYWAGDATGQRDAERWRDAQPKVAGSWWEDWDRWLQQQCGEAVLAPVSMGNATYRILYSAPGQYVREK